MKEMIKVMTNRDEKRKTMPPTYFLGAILLMIGLRFFLPAMQFLPAWWSLVGVLPIIMGIIANLFADKKFQLYKTTIRPFEESNTLVTNGIYNISRNPMYLGMVMVLVGVMLLLNNLFLLGVLVGFVFIISTNFIRTEEKNVGH